MRTTVFIIALVATSALASKSLFKSEAQNKFGGLKAIQEIENSKFGRQLLDTIALQMKNETPLQDVAQLLADIRSDLLMQQREDDALQAAREEDCELTIADYEFKIDTAVANIATAVQTIAALRSEITDTKAAILGYEDQVTILTAQLVTVHADRAEDRVAFQARNEKSSSTIAALVMITPKLKSLAPRSAAMALAQLSNIGKSNPIQAFLEVAATIDPELLNSVVVKMEQLQESLEASMAEDAVNEEAAEAMYVALVAKLDEALASVQEALSQAQSNLAQAEAKLAATEAFLEEQQAVEAAARAGLAAKIEECRVWKVNYDNTKASRAAEQHVVEQVQAILAERLAGMSDYLAGRVDHD